MSVMHFIPPSYVSIRGVMPGCCHRGAPWRVRFSSLTSPLKKHQANPTFRSQSWPAPCSMFFRAWTDFKMNIRCCSFLWRRPNSICLFSVCLQAFPKYARNDDDEKRGGMRTARTTQPDRSLFCHILIPGTLANLHGCLVIMHYSSAAQAMIWLLIELLDLLDASSGTTWACQTYFIVLCTMYVLHWTVIMYAIVCICFLMTVWNSFPPPLPSKSMNAMSV